MATITVNELATTLDTDARTARKFLRSITPIDAQPGKGSRWSIEKVQVRSLTSKFAKFQAAQAEAKVKVTVTLDEQSTEVEMTTDDFDALTDPTDDDLADIDAE